MQLTGIHHVTAVTGHAAENLDFYTRLLGMRLVKKTVNQDDVTAYHLFYGDAEGHAGTELTFFDWPTAAPRTHGPGTVTRTALRVPSRASLDWWSERLAQQGVSGIALGDDFGRATLRFEDPEGQALALVEDGGAPGGTPWSGADVPAEHAIRGLGPVTITVDDFAPSEAMLTRAMGFRRAREVKAPDGREAVVFETGPGGAGAEVNLVLQPDAPDGRVGRGGVHHVAFRTPTPEEHSAWQRDLMRMGVRVTPVIDRFYFKSIYFREPGGVLFEIATDGPGFATDEPMEHLGERLALPPFLEPRRAQIEAGLKPLPNVGAVAQR